MEKRVYPKVLFLILCPALAIMPFIDDVNKTLRSKEASKETGRFGKYAYQYSLLDGDGVNGEMPGWSPMVGR